MAHISSLQADAAEFFYDLLEGFRPMVVKKVDA